MQCTARSQPVISSSRGEPAEARRVSGRAGHPVLEGLAPVMRLVEQDPPLRAGHPDRIRRHQGRLRLPLSLGPAGLRPWVAR